MLAFHRRPPMFIGDPKKLKIILLKYTRSPMKIWVDHNLWVFEENQGGLRWKPWGQLKFDELRPLMAYYITAKIFSQSQTFLKKT